MSAAKILDRCDRPKQTRPGHFMFGCPLCQSKQGRPISLRELDDGRVLMHPFCGHETGDVLTALGLTMSDLFPERFPGNGPAGGYAPSHSRIPARDLLELIDHEVMIAALILRDVLDERLVTDQQWSRLASAAARIGKARDHAKS